MDKDTYDRGLAMRRKVLGDAYVDRALANVDDFNRDFQRIVTQYGWGETSQVGFTRLVRLKAPDLG